MVHSEKGPATRAMLYTTPVLGLPKSPSFHSGLDLMAGSHANVKAASGLAEENAAACNDRFGHPGYELLNQNLPLLIGKDRRLRLA